MAQKYKETTKDDVFGVLVSASCDVFNPVNGIINIVNVASILGTSKYQTRKHIKSLVAEGLVLLDMCTVPDEEECYPPYWGYTLTEKGKETEKYKQRMEQSIKLINEVFYNYQ